MNKKIVITALASTIVGASIGSLYTLGLLIEDEDVRALVAYRLSNKVNKVVFGKEFRPSSRSCQGSRLTYANYGHGRSYLDGQETTGV